MLKVSTSQHIARLQRTVAKTLSLEIKEVKQAKGLIKQFVENQRQRQLTINLKDMEYEDRFKIFGYLDTYLGKGIKSYTRDETNDLLIIEK